MASNADSRPTRRRYERATGPFDGAILDAPVLVYDLNQGGCFVNSSQESPDGTVAILKINLGDEGWITVTAETRHHLEHGFGVGFLDLDPDTAARISRTVAVFKHRRPF